jgi:hypothetical protein
VIIKYSNIVQLERFVVDLKGNSKVIALLPDKSVAYLKSKDFSKLKISKKPQQNLTFELTMHDKKINSVDDLQSVIAKL